MRNIKYLIFMIALCSAMALFAQNDSTLQVEGLKRGVYRSFQEFATNSPSVSDSISIHEYPRNIDFWNGTYNYRVLRASTAKPVRRVWGFSDGKHAFVKHQEEFFQVKVENGRYTFQGYAPFESELALRAVKSGVDSNVEWVKNLAKRNRCTYVINSESGEIIGPIDAKYTPTVEGLCRKLIVYRPVKREAAQVVRISLNDEPCIELLPGSIQSVSVRFNGEPMKVCVCESDTQCTTFMLDRVEEGFVKISKTEAEEATAIEPVTSTIGEFDLYNIHKALKRKK